MKYAFITTKIQRILYCGIFLVHASLGFIAADGVEQSVKKYADQTNAVSQSFRGWSRANPRKKIVATDLSLYRLLVTIQSNISGFLKDFLIQDDDAQGLERKQNLALAGRLAGETITLLDEIVLDLNRQCFSYNPEIEYHFVKMCNTLKGVDFESIAPYQIREQNEQVKQFDQYLKLYCLSRKDFLNKADLDLFNKITKFNQMLMLCLLNEDYFEIGLFDTFVDYTVHRPWEFMCENPYLTAAVVGSVVAAVGYFWIYPWWIRYDNQNKEFSVQQDHGLKQGPGDCGYYGLLHALIRRNAAGEEEFNAMVARAKVQENLLQPWKDAIGLDGWIEQPDIERILQNEALVNQVMQPIVGAGKNVARDNVIVLARNLADPEARRAAVLEEHYALQRMRRAQGLPEQAPPDANRIDDLVAEILPDDGNNEFVNQLRRNNVAQHVVLRLPRHWVTVSVEPDADSPHRIRAKIVNSMHRNVTDYAAVNQLLRTCSID